MSVHYRTVEQDGDVVDLIPFCTDWCNRDYCLEHNLEYQGWNGCHELTRDEKCAKCDKILLWDCEDE